MAFNKASLLHNESNSAMQGSGGLRSGVNKDVFCVCMYSLGSLKKA